MFSRAIGSSLCQFPPLHFQIGSQKIGKYFLLASSVCRHSVTDLLNFFFFLLLLVYLLLEYFNNMPTNQHTTSLSVVSGIYEEVGDLQYESERGSDQFSKRFRNRPQVRHRKWRKYKLVANSCLLELRMVDVLATMR